ncbi:hypothetical protein [Paraburkholderia sp.]|uniref:beta strand repeat-containing protein n=1 Tax=Paraburkholderia sp. TaxID=1926495 RepID=UPI00238BEF97|nr:hypothetical protein [Paraburkholderia sp.]MDE1183638.1 hypothetical protein [Paraburkholderia sp.]
MKRTLIAAAVLTAASSSVFAASNPYIFNATMVGTAVGVEGWVALYGCVHVSSSAGAVINNNQSVNFKASLDPQAQSYVTGSVTTHFNNANYAVVGSGTNSTYDNRTNSGSQSASFSESSSSSRSQSSSSSKNSSSAYGYNNTASSSIVGAYHATSDSGTAHVTSNTSGQTTTHVDANTHAASAGANYTASHSQGAQGSVTLGVATSSSGNIGNGQAAITFGAAEQTSSGSSGAIAGNFGSSQTNTSGSQDTHSDGSTSTAANAGYADGTLSAGVTKANSGNGSKSYQASRSESSSSSRSQSASASESSSHSSQSSSGHSWGYSVNDTLAITDQTTTGSVTQHYNTQVAGTLNATTGTNAASGVSGNLGINIAEGANNAQSNDVALASVDIGNVFGNAQIFNTQTTAGTAKINNFNLNASIGDGSLSNVTGNVGVNVASGLGNVQNNSLAGAVTTTKAGQANTTAMVATDESTQTAALDVKGQFQGTAMLGANALNGASGNIGVNIAGGAGNLQHNGLAIAALNSGH